MAGKWQAASFREEKILDQMRPFARGCRARRFISRNKSREPACLAVSSSSETETHTHHCHIVQARFGTTTPSHEEPCSPRQEASRHRRWRRVRAWVRLQGRHERVGVRVPVAVVDDHDASQERRRNDDGQPDVCLVVLHLGGSRGGAAPQEKCQRPAAGGFRQHGELLRPAARAQRAGEERRVVERAECPPRRGEALARGVPVPAAGAQESEEVRRRQGRLQRRQQREPARLGSRRRGVRGQRGGGEAVGRPAGRLPAVDAAVDRGERDRRRRGPARDAPPLPDAQLAAPPRRHPPGIRRDLGRRVCRCLPRPSPNSRPGLCLAPRTGQGGRAQDAATPPSLTSGVARVRRMYRVRTCFQALSLHFTPVRYHFTRELDRALFSRHLRTCFQALSLHFTPVRYHFTRELDRALFCGTNHGRASERRKEVSLSFLELGSMGTETEAGTVGACGRAVVDGARGRQQRGGEE
jgi:hypothetical protein